MITVDGNHSFILAKERFEKTTTLLVLNEGCDLLDKPLETY